MRNPAKIALWQYDWCFLTLRYKREVIIIFKFIMNMTYLIEYCEKVYHFMSGSSIVYILFKALYTWWFLIYLFVHFFGNVFTIWCILQAHIVKTLMVSEKTTSYLVYRNYPNYEPRHDKTNKMNVRPANTQISLGLSYLSPRVLS